MMFRRVFCLSLLVLALSQAGCSQIRSIAGSHIEANVPDAKDFDNFLKRDLTNYVTDSKDKDISVNIELLRKEPTQSGVALPKFYVWLQKLDANGKVMEEAALRIAAIEKTHFEVVQYYEKDRVLKEQDLIYKVFPDEVADKIMERAKRSE